MDKRSTIAISGANGVKRWKYKRAEMGRGMGGGGKINKKCRKLRALRRPRGVGEGEGTGPDRTGEVPCSRGEMPREIKPKLNPGADKLMRNNHREFQCVKTKQKRTSQTKMRIKCDDSSLRKRWKEEEVEEEGESGSEKEETERERRRPRLLRKTREKESLRPRLKHTTRFR
ncbi:uncharacterized protein BO97DRAFT_104902 [Aspergillus homomorphus CBS 101889]|uniref:Uncharacterized protein n=1 Tax=Aspergillus homomorphus (strain CBS 101889) TaxID=1450537 RepID=A0A395HTH5_ASPHC|nr:hypothetical protein BO97DRAFT_104902 [Aspergillus homomorphus CBS 101889]RAL11117.1 hypothetical protein BO97DRAFT_104902 [Aspergillus homomorphus CBS 101889]